MPKYPRPIPALLPALWVLTMLAVWLIGGWQLPWVSPVWEFVPDDVPRGLVQFVSPLLLAILPLTITGLAVARRQGFERGLLSPLLLAAVINILAGVMFWLHLGPLAQVFVPTLLWLVAVTTALLAMKRGRTTRPALRFAGEALLLIPVYTVLILAACAPAVESDGLRYHLTAPMEWSRAGGFLNLPYSANSNLPSLLGLVALLSGPVAGIGVAYQALNVGSALIVSLLSGSIAGCLYRSLRSTARPDEAGSESMVFWSTAMLTATVPVNAIIAAWPFADMLSTAFLLGAIVVIIHRGRLPKIGRWIAAGLLLGAACATKLSVLPLAGIVGVWAAATAGRRWWLATLTMVGTGLFVLAPWLVKSLVFHGNPVYPLGFGVFGGPEWSAANDEFYKAKAAEKGMGRGVLDFLLVPVRATFQYGRFESHTPGVTLIAFLPILAGGMLIRGVRNRLRRLNPAWCICIGLLVLGFPIWFVTYQSVRFLIPEIALLCAIGSCIAIYTAEQHGGRLTVMLTRAALLAVALTGFAWSTYYRIALTPTLQAAVGRIGVDAFVGNRFNAFGAIRWLEENTSPNEPVFYIGEHRGFYAFHYKPILSDWFDTPRVLVEIRETASNEALLERWRGLGIRYVLLNMAELGQYEELYFKPRFTPVEWARFVDLRQQLVQRVVHESSPGVYICRIDGDATP
ncbi:hypothetical protein GC173_12590 [bacterium]|nr:hypothetical protein [bacterium]